jgi:hypothetical protein
MIAPPPSSTRACPLGCAGYGTALLELPTTMDIALSRSHFTLTRCPCGLLLYLSPAPDEQDLRSKYVDHQQFGDEYTDPQRVQQILAYMSEALARIATKKRWPQEKPLRVLEIGAGLAWMCRAAKVRNSASVTVAQDVSPEAAARCEWVDAYVQAPIDDPRVQVHAPYDVISLTHVIEHLIDPVATVRRCQALLATEGVTFVTAPFRPRGWRDDAPDAALWRSYSYNHVPAHVQYFSEGSMRRLADAVGLALTQWSDRHDGGQAFEAWLEKPQQRSRVAHIRAKLGGWMKAARA